MAFVVGVTAAVNASPSSAATDYPLPTTDAGLSDIVTAPDGALYFAEEKGGKVGRIGLDGATTEFPVPSHDEYGPNDLTVTGDGKVWFVSDSGDTVGYVDSAQGNAVRALSLSDGLGNTIGQSLTPAPDGSVYVADRFGETVTRVVAGAGGPEFSWTRDIDCGFDGAMAAGHGSVWCAFEGTALKRIDAAGNATNFPTADGFSIASLTAGPDAAMWFSRHSSNGSLTSAGYGSVGRVGLDGSVQEWKVGDTFAPHGLIAGPDGAIWFTDVGRTNTLGRVVPGEGVPQLATLGPRRAAAITFGGDGALWFADQNANRITRMGTIEVFPPPAPPTPQPVPTPQPAPGPGPKPRVLRLASTKLRAKGTSIPVRIVCPAGSERCRGTVRIRTATKVRVPGRKARKRAVLTVAARYDVRAGATKTVKVKFSRSGRRLARSAARKVVVELTPRGTRKAVIANARLAKAR